MWCVYSDAYFFVRRTIDLLAGVANENDKADKNVAFKNNASFRSCISKINGTLIHNAEGFDMAMYNLLEYSQSYFIELLQRWIWWCWW